MSYVHGYSERESERLKDQSGILETLLHTGTSYPAGSRVLEAGCGVGAQTKILAKNSPHAEITSIDISETSLSMAVTMARKKKVTNVCFKQASILDTPFKDETFDHVFVCFVLEHLKDPLQALSETKRVLRPGGTLTLIEGDHGSCFWHPKTDASAWVWQALIKVQEQLGHDPLIGRRLYPLLKKAGFDIHKVFPRWIYTDAGKPELMDGMVNRIIVPMVESSKTEILEKKIVDISTWEQGLHDLKQSGLQPEGTFFYTWFKGLGIKKD